MNEDQAIEVKYTNYRGETSIRKVVPTAVSYSEGNEWHPNPGWELVVYDVEKGETRFFRLQDCDFTTFKNDEAPGAFEKHRDAALDVAGAAMEKTGKFFQNIAARMKKDG